MRNVLTYLHVHSIHTVLGLLMVERQYLLYHSVFATQIEFKKTFMLKAIDMRAQTFEINMSHLQKFHISLPRLV